MPTQQKLLRTKDAIAMRTEARSTFYRDVCAGVLPPCLKISVNSTWLAHELQQATDLDVASARMDRVSFERWIKGYAKAQEGEHGEPIGDWFWKRADMLRTSRRWRVADPKSA